MVKLIETVETVVRDVLGSTSLKDSMTSADVHSIVREVRRRIETHCDNGSTAPATDLYRFMLPDRDSMANTAAQVRVSHVYVLLSTCFMVSSILSLKCIIYSSLLVFSPLSSVSVTD